MRNKFKLEIDFSSFFENMKAKNDYNVLFRLKNYFSTFFCCFIKKSNAIIVLDVVDMDIKGIYFEKYKCFEKGLIDNIKPINVVFGKNNIGKSSVLDVIEGLYNNRIVCDKLMISTELNESQIEDVFSKTTSGGIIAGNHFEYGKKFIGKNIWVELSKVVSSFKKEFVDKGPVDNSIFEPKFNYHWKRITSSVHYDKKIIKRIFAERNVLPEDLTSDVDVDGNGNGITNIINNYLNNNDFEEGLVRDKLLNKLNEIMGEDATFTEIVTQQIGFGEPNKWEIFLREENKGRIALSSSGSGLKTILMVLVYTILVPDEEQEEVSNYLFMFEELENNLHPSLQRRLLNYIEELTKEGATFFLTTHSNVVLDAFQNNDDVNMLHVIKNEENKVNIINVSDNLQKNNVLNDLGIKASDLLQSNGIIWVEGPSDRIYMNKWIELWSEGKYREGKNYQCIFYGGRLLSHMRLSLDEENDLINLIKSNRNCIVMIDSDKRTSRTPINATKKRIYEECLQNNIMCWITKGREIENYLSESVIKNHYSCQLCDASFGQYEKINYFLDNLKEGLGNKFLNSKANFASEITKELTKADFEEVLDLNEQMQNIIAQIEKWNR